MSHPAFLIKDHDRLTIAGMRVLSEVTTHGALSIAGAGCFLTREAEDRFKADAIQGATRLLQLSFDNGRVVTAPFVIDAIHYAGNVGTERNYHVHLRSQGSVQ